MAPTPSIVTATPPRAASSGDERAIRRRPSATALPCRARGSRRRLGGRAAQLRRDPDDERRRDEERGGVDEERATVSTASRPRSCSFRRASPAAQVAAELEPLAKGEEASRRRRLRRRDDPPARRSARAEPTILVATPSGLAAWVKRRRLWLLARGPGPRARRSRAHARHGVQAPGRPPRAHACPKRAADDALLGHARRRGRRARPRLHERTQSHFEARPPEDLDHAGRVEHTLRLGHEPRTSSTG